MKLLRTRTGFRKGGVDTFTRRYADKASSAQPDSQPSSGSSRRRQFHFCVRACLHISCGCDPAPRARRNIRSFRPQGQLSRRCRRSRIPLCRIPDEHGTCSDGIPDRRPLPAAAATKTAFAPKISRVFAASFAVAPVVMTSSTSSTVLPSINPAFSGYGSYTPKRFPCRLTAFCWSVLRRALSIWWSAKPTGWRR